MGAVFGNEKLTAALPDRLTDHAKPLTANDSSFRPRTQDGRLRRAPPLKSCTGAVGASGLCRCGGVKTFGVNQPQCAVDTALAGDRPRATG